MASEKVSKRTRDIYERLLEGYSRKEVHSHIIFNYPELKSARSRENAIHDAYKYAEVEAFKDKEYTFHTHIDRYDKMYKESMVMENQYGTPLDPTEDWQLMVAKYSNALKALKMKEQLLGLHDKNVSIEINNRMATVITNTQETRGAMGGYDFSKLNLNEKIELLELVKLARKPVDGIFPVLIKQNEISVTIGGDLFEEEETEEVEYEELPEEVVTKFQKKQREVDDRPEIDKLKESALSPDDVVAKLHQTAKEEFLKVIKNKKENI